MANLGEVSGGIGQVDDKVAEALGHLQHAQDCLDQSQQALSVLEGSSQSDADQAAAYFADANSKTGDVQQMLNASRELLEAIRGRIGETAIGTTVAQPPAPASPPSAPDIKKAEPASAPPTSSNTPASPSASSETPDYMWNRPEDVDTSDFVAPEDSPNSRQAGTIRQTIRADKDAVPLLPGYIDKGSNMFVFQSANNPDHCIKVPGVYEYDESLDIVQEEYVEPLVRGRGIDGLEQIVEYEPKTGDNPGSVTVEKAEGTRLDKLMAGGATPSEPEHYRKLVATLEQMGQHDLAPDDAKNVMYSPDKGFTVIDYGRALDESERTPAGVIASFVDQVLHGRTSDNSVPDTVVSLIAAYRDMHGQEATADLKGLITNPWINSVAPQAHLYGLRLREVLRHL